MSRRLQALLVPVALALAAGCAPTLRVTSFRPAPINLGTARSLSVLETSGRHDGRKVAVQELIRRADWERYFTLADRTGEGLSVRLSGGAVVVNGGTGEPLRPDEVGLRIDVLDWSTMRVDHPEQRDKKGNVTQAARTVYLGKVAIQVTAFNAQGRVFLAEQEFNMRDALPMRLSMMEVNTEPGALREAMYYVVSQLVSAITPGREERDVRLDGDDESQRAIIELARAGNLDQASAELKTYLDRNPTSAAALYNMAVILDAQGQYQEALDLYTKAISQSPKGFYAQAKHECARRLANQQAMEQ